MRRTIRYALALAATVFLLSALAFCIAAGHGPAGNLARFQSILSSKGFQCNQGTVAFPDWIGMGCACELPSCWGNNPSSTYGAYVLPPAPGQTALNPWAEAFSTAEQPNWSCFWRLRPDEAIVFIGQTPPTMTYFGFVSYLFDRAGTPPANPACSPRPPSVANRAPEVFSSLHDTLNPLTIKTAWGRGQPFAKATIIITAADKGTAAAVRSALLRAGYPDSIINLDVIPSAIVKLGIDQAADSFQSVIRLSPLDPTAQAVHDYMANPGTVWRVTPTIVTPADQLDPLPVPRLRVRGTGHTELDLLPAVEELRQAILDVYADDYDYLEIPSVDFMEGYSALQANENALGDNRDTVFLVNGPFTSPDVPYLLGEDEFIVVYGVNHAATGKATYSNFAVTGGKLNVGAGSVRSEFFPGSAEDYLPHSTITPKLYAWTIRRQQTGPGAGGPLAIHCLEIGSDCEQAGIPVDEPLRVVFRAYLEKATRVGPAYPELVHDRTIKFTPKP